MDIKLISIAFFLLLAIILLLFILFKSIKKQSFIADDGSIFENKSDLELYQSLYLQTKPLFTGIDETNSSQQILGFDKSFLIKVTKDGFPNLKTLVKYRTQFRLLSDLINS